MNNLISKLCNFVTSKGTKKIFLLMFDLHVYLEGPLGFERSCAVKL